MCFLDPAVKPRDDGSTSRRTMKTKA
ncbi:MAG TPA: hypothetical protein DIC51_01310 [Coxiellaceae bacterium]|nr:hypothetical protein [Coxiellaceae bacterium]